MRLAFSVLCFVSAASSYAAAPAPQLKFNQSGYHHQGQKLAVIPGKSQQAFQLVALPSGKIVFKGQSSEAQLWAPAGESVSIADFTKVQTNGSYRLEVAGYAAVELQIAAQPYAQLHDAAIKAYYFNRASQQLDKAYAGVWARPAGHPDDKVKIHASAASASRPTGTVVQSPKGWYDAGDYNKYIVNSGISTFTLLDAWTDFTDFYRQRQWTIPESGNSMPDLLDEVLWNLDWMSSMQDPADGGVYHKLTTLNFEGAVMPHQAVAQRYLVQKTTAAALNFAAVMAKASRVLSEFDKEQPGKAVLFRQQAIQAWQWASKNPDIPYQQPADVNTGAYGDKNLADEFAWAAAELYLLTGEEPYLQQFFQLAQPVQTASWASVAALGYFSLAKEANRLKPAQRQLVFSAITAVADQFAAQHQASAYKVAMVPEDFVWGSNAVAMNKAILLYKANQITAKASYVEAMQGLLDYVLGRNPLDLSYVTGFGVKSPQHIHHRPSEADGIKAPVPGWLAGGAQPGQQDKCKYSSTLPAKSYVDDWCSYASNEVTINWNAPLVYMLAAFSQPD
ncbi:glycoside hydrolase family 9 protein [Rheinheimera sp. 1928-s]|uniref:glycoside hydrolase family 9 protein n=1 Tax=Rheinheimera sp. 1928-s TaxID=3033803 RepID=UPI00262EC45B|nr:glycoside hydrolase family 9 protein [Rheinheimera sp. 1928-s]MDF3125210.1 glycoside hydrolase family 9 protein [Rheinheimera sp. 1928-s]